jgi:TRAP-type mannitol/chloroaromatic compound transport system permease small subunit
MIAALKAFIHVVDGLNWAIGRVVMYGIFVMMGILLWSSVSKTFVLPSLWTLEMAQFAMVAYYMLGGPYSIQLGSNVRMDLLYGAWSDRKKAQIDAITVLFLIFYLVVLLWGGLSSTSYSLGDFKGEPISHIGGIVGGFLTGGPDGASAEVGRLERSPTAWRPYLWPIKSIMIIGIFLMLLQALSELFKDILRLKGEPTGDKT